MFFNRFLPRWAIPVLGLAFALDVAADTTSMKLDAKAVRTYAAQLAPTGVTRRDFQAVRVVRDVDCVHYGASALSLDLFLPADDNATYPCVITIVGGGFRSRDQSKFAPYAAYFATQGLASACISYRGVPEAHFVQTIQDCKAAVRFVRTHAQSYGIDPHRIGAFGQSAGAHLAAMLAVSDGVPELDDSETSHVSTRIQAAVCFAGPFDFVSRLRDGGHQQKNLETKKRTNGAWIGEPFAEDSPRWILASPITHLSADDPPLLMVHTKTDETVPFAQSVQMHAAMQARGLESKLLILDTGGHGIASAPEISEQVWLETIRFFQQHLGESTPRNAAR